MNPKPFTVQINARTVTFTSFTEVAGAEYLAPVQSFTISLKDFRELVAHVECQPGNTSFFNFTEQQLQAHGAATLQPTSA